MARLALLGRAEKRVARRAKRRPRTSTQEGRALRVPLGDFWTFRPLAAVLIYLRMVGPQHAVDIATALERGAVRTRGAYDRATYRTLVYARAHGWVRKRPDGAWEATARPAVVKVSRAA